MKEGRQVVGSLNDPWNFQYRRVVGYLHHCVVTPKIQNTLKLNTSKNENVTILPPLESYFIFEVCYCKQLWIMNPWPTNFNQRRLTITTLPEIQKSNTLCDSQARKSIPKHIQYDWTSQPEPYRTLLTLSYLADITRKRNPLTIHCWLTLHLKTKGTPNTSLD